MLFVGKKITKEACGASLIIRNMDHKLQSNLIYLLITCKLRQSFGADPWLTLYYLWPPNKYLHSWLMAGKLVTKIEGKKSIWAPWEFIWKSWKQQLKASFVRLNFWINKRKMLGWGLFCICSGNINLKSKAIRTIKGH